MPKVLQITCYCLHCDGKTVANKDPQQSRDFIILHAWNRANQYALSVYKIEYWK